MAESAPRRDADVIDMVEYLTETLEKIDRMIGELVDDRRDISMRLAVIKASTSDRVQEAAADFERQVASGEPFSGEDAESFLSEAYKRYVR